MRCLCCGKNLKNENDNWHKTCINKFFGTNILPEIDSCLLNETIEKLGDNIVANNKSITGVQKKLSLHLSNNNLSFRLTLLGYPQGYILKPNSKEFPYIAEAEHLVMTMANTCGIVTAPHALIKIKDNMSYITKRVDRKEQNKIHMEDFCQLSGRLTEYKYSASYEKCAKIIDKYSINPMLDKTELFYRLLFCYITGNSDMHLKNFSLIDSERGYVLSPAYDLLPVKIIINDLDDLALTLNGKTRKVTKNDFMKFGSNIGIPSLAVNKLIKKIVGLENKFIILINESFLPEEVKGEYINFIKNKINIFK